MPQNSREAIYGALFTKIQGAYAWALSSRRMFPIGDIEQIKQPAFILRQGPSEKADQNLALGLTRWHLDAEALIFFRVDTTQDAAIAPATIANALLDAVEAVIRTPVPNERQTLGGLVENAAIEGEILIDDGSNDGQGVLVIPIKILTG